MTDTKPFAVRFEGEGVEPDSIETVTTLAFVVAYIELVTAVAEMEHLQLSLGGLEVRDKCAEFRIAPSNPQALEMCAIVSNALLDGTRAPVRGTATAARNARDSFRRLPSHYRCSVVVDERIFNLKVEPQQTRELPWELVEMRATPVRVGGAQPRVAFSSEIELRQFTVSCSSDQARALGAMLYQAVDVTLQITRREDGSIEFGELIECRPLEDRDPFAAWQEWFARNGAAWNDVEDIEAELGRD